MFNVKFHPEALAEINKWREEDPKIHQKIGTLIFNMRETPFEGLGKPEGLKYQLSGCWSRRITQEHRLVYYVEDNDVYIISARYHYGKKGKSKKQEAHLIKRYHAHK